MVQSHAQHYREKYEQGVIRRDHTLNLYNQFLENLGEKQSLEELVARILVRKKIVRILDIGCGNGNALAELKQLFGEKVYTLGIDLIPPDTKENVDEFLEGDVHEVPIPMECDLILSFRALHEMGNLSKLIPKLAKSLTPGGRAYLWIRMREANEGKPVFVGEMNTAEEKALHGLAANREINGSMMLLQSVETPIPVTYESQPRKSMIGGYIVLLHRPL